MQKFRTFHALGLGLGAILLMNEAPVDGGAEGGAAAPAPEPTAAELKKQQAAEQKRLQKEEKDKKAAEKKAEQERKREEAEARKAEREKAKESKNGVTRPQTGVTKQVWDIADKISAEKRRPAERKEVTEEGLKLGIQQGTIHTQYGRWRKYHGLSSVREAAASDKSPAEDQAGAPTTEGGQAAEG